MLIGKVEFWDEVEMQYIVQWVVSSVDTIYCYITSCPESDGRVQWQVHVSIWGYKIILILFNSMKFASNNLVPDPSLVFYQNFSEAAYKLTAIKICIVLQVSCTQ